VTGDPTLDPLFPEQWPSIVTVTTVTGERVTNRVDYPKGDPENFLSWEELVEKFCQLSNRLLSDKKRRMVIEEVKNLEKAKEVGKILRHFRPSALP